jgi:hypothetical protein
MALYTKQMNLFQSLCHMGIDLNLTNSVRKQQSIMQPTCVTDLTLLFTIEW